MASRNLVSDAYDVDQMIIDWVPSLPIDRNRNIKLSDMQLVAISPGKCNGTYLTGIWSVFGPIQPPIRRQPSSSGLASLPSSACSEK